ncbi:MULTISPECIES: asparagine synthetase B family protein [Actinoallomurus]|uniref:hypothetical protein n=1 Tax=Actinoallomurus TaxID=667113 RepID=UPI002092959C|nr:MULTISPECIES: hypothetical protein [Actinoallomurus]MCO5969205.1 hypothetical protein [Actinoallomurus soli]MCO5998716.1 hypothetical protein [Actinoallomurus rhizosphaericola]
MLKLKISIDDTNGPWTWDGRRWTHGRSWIEPYAHPALERLHAYGRFCIRERMACRDGQPADFLDIRIDAGRVRITAGLRGVAPLYVAEQAGVLHGSWDLFDLRPHIDPGKLLDREVARLLAFRVRYGHDTVFAGVYRISERSTAVYDRNGLTLHYPEPALHSRSRQLRPDVDDAAVIDAYEQLLAGAVAGHRYDPASSCVELSGGMDSANVAATLGALHPAQVSAGALIILGDAGRQQIRRRDAFIDLLQLGADTQVTLGGRLPFCPGGRRGPYDDAYAEAKNILLARLAGQGVRTVFTGIGGDEMVAVTSREWPHPPYGTELETKSWIGDRVVDGLKEAEDNVAPAAVINEMTLSAQACAAPAFLRAGMWPVHPLADPRLITFGEWLPLGWRRHKRLHRERLEHRGCHGELIHPPLVENFAPVMREGLRRHGVAHINVMLGGGSPLIDGGYVAADGLADARDRIARGQFLDRDAELYMVLALDLTLRSFS